MNNFWLRTTKAMAEQGITQADLARIINVPPYRISKWIRDEINPQVNYAIGIASGLHKTVEELFSGDQSFDPAVSYIKKDPALRSLVIKLGLHPELVVPVDAYLSGYMDSHGFNQEEDKANHGMTG